MLFGLGSHLASVDVVSLADVLFFLSNSAMPLALLTAWLPWPRSSMTTLASWRVLW